MKLTRFTFYVLLVSAVCWTGCEMFANHTDPIAGWQLEFSGQPDQAMEKDYQDYVQALPSEEKRAAGMGFYYKDGTGQHALVVEVALNGTWWYHVLIYDKDNKRIKTIKYSPGHYRS